MDSAASGSEPSHFRTTAWSVVAGAQDIDGESRERCLSKLCRTYWKPIYYYMRRRRLNHDDALDITQEYFATFLEKNFVAAADREKGKFRTFVLVTVNRFLSKQIAKRNRHEAKRSIHIPVEDGEEEFILTELSHGETAEDDFNRRWALSLIEETMNKMEAECDDGRKRLYYETFKLFIDSQSSTRPLSYRDMAEKLGVTEGDVTNFLHRGRNVFQKLLRNEIRQSVSSESEIDEEIEALKEYLRK
ncbi:MAG: sigma-70 family RNA polymerase sigma factor [Planctomycetes bacterium]|nr:sigma-70 family RNA polymerase sigma factor [Planctomycetota bacterium]